MTEVATGDERHGSFYLPDCLLDAIAEAHVIFVRQKTVTERDDASQPTVSLQKIKRDRGTVIEIESFNPHSREALFSGNTRDLVEQFIVKFEVNGCGWSPKV